MATLIVKDLDTRHELDFRAMSCIRGGGAPWVFGWIQPYVATRPLPCPGWRGVDCRQEKSCTLHNAACGQNRGGDKTPRP